MSTVIAMPDDESRDQSPPEQPHPERRNWMAVLARAGAASIAERIAISGGAPEYQRLRGPDAGLVMVRGRAGGGGVAFNLGEMTVTRCSVRTDAGFVGHAYVAGRDERQAELAAVADALLQDPTRRPHLLTMLIEPLAAAQQAARNATAAKAAATRVQFFAMRNMRA
jgi:alpha-D-ribose 1-methylphosphonate 5-triphosphate synthase subunit PhnG